MGTVTLIVPLRPRSQAPLLVIPARLKGAEGSCQPELNAPTVTNALAAPNGHSKMFALGVITPLLKIYSVRVVLG